MQMKFTEFDIHQRVLDGIREAQFETAMPVQEQVFAHSLKGKDILVQSQTGSGKTAAFLITILDQYVRRSGNVKALIIVPTRELADQIEDDAKLLAAGIPEIRIATFFGGMGYHRQDKAVNAGVDLFIGTPGRLIDFQSSNKIDFRSLDIVVIDEADRLFDMGFYPDIKKMLSKMRSKTERQTMLFSATLTTRVRHLAWEFMNDPATVEITPENITVEDIKQEMYHVTKHEKFKLLLHILRTKDPATALIFTNTRHRAVEVSKRLQLNGYHSQFLMGDLPQRKRLKIIDTMKEGSLRYLVATDVAARGLHINDLSLVVNYDIPEDYESYVHRIGRTARAGKSGAAVSFACEQFVYGVEAIENFIGMKISVEWCEDLDRVVDKSADVPAGDLKYRAKQEPRKPGRGGGSRRRKDGKPERGGDRRKPREQQKSQEIQNEPAGKPKPKPKPKRDPAAAASRPKGRKPQAERKEGLKPQEVRDIQGLPLEERIAYYKQKYGASMEQKSKEQPKQQAPENKPPQRKQQPAAPRKEKPKQKRKRGLLGRLLGKDS